MVPLGDAATLQRGFDLPVQERIPGDVPVFAANGPVGTHSEAKILGPGVVTGRSGTIGKVHFVDGDFWPLNTSLFVKDFHGNDPKYIYYLLGNMRLERFHEGTGVPTLNRNNIHGVTVPLPPLSEQKWIADVLDKADAIRRKRREAIGVAESFVSGLFMEMFAPNRTPDSAAVRVMSFDDAVSDFIDYRGKTPAKSSSGIPLVTAKVIKNGRILPADEFIPARDYEAWMRRGLPRTGDVLFTTEAPLGEVAQVTDERIALAQRVLLMRGKRGVLNNTFLRLAIKTPFVWNQIQSRSTGSTVRGIRQKELRQVTLPVPSIEEQDRFERIARRQEESIEALRTATVNSEQLFHVLVQRAFRGEL
jgi:type I restriction enzyme S subunit